MEGQETVAFKMSGLSQAITIFTNIPGTEVKKGREVILKKENIENGDKKQMATIQKLLFEKKTGFLKSVIKKQVILNVSEESGSLYNGTNHKNYQGYCAVEVMDDVQEHIAIWVLGDSKRIIAMVDVVPEIEIGSKPKDFPTVEIKRGDIPENDFVEIIESSGLDKKSQFFIAKITGYKGMIDSGETGEINAFSVKIEKT